MNIVTVLLFCVILYGSKVTFAEGEGRSSDEVVEDQDPTLSDQEQGTDVPSSAEEITGPPDSHEAMNNREFASSVKSRDKRSYEFLMGLINNNSKFEVTKVDPAAHTATIKPEVTAEQLAASELLLELMVRIAAHPDQWEKVHQLLQKIDKDILVSKNILNDLKKHNLEIREHNSSKEAIHVNKKQSSQIQSKETTTVETIPHITETNADSSNVWPNFNEESKNQNKVTFVKTTEYKENVEKPGKYPWEGQNKPAKSYPKNFAYHRVTGKPIYLNKNPKAYIAVSVIAPKQHTRSQEEDVTLENELRQLKPWTHEQNLKNMASIRSRWVIQTDENTNADA